MKDFNFIKKNYKVHGIEIFSDDLLEKKIHFTHTYKSKVEL
jgi:hypothetical protein